MILTFSTIIVITLVCLFVFDNTLVSSKMEISLAFLPTPSLWMELTFLGTLIRVGANLHLPPYSAPLPLTTSRFSAGAINYP